MTNPRTDIEALIENEWYAVRYSGEIPEVALHSALHHLCEDPDGPQIELSGEQRSQLLEGVCQRYLEITLRDLLPENLVTGSYRGIKRSFINWQRFTRFCRFHKLHSSVYRELVAAALMELFKGDLTELSTIDKGRMFNCTGEELETFMQLLEIDPGCLTAQLKASCFTALIG
ncbi:MAG: hypothetical protein P8X39_07625 [Desulfofustis sp.]